MALRCLTRWRKTRCWRCWTTLICSEALQHHVSAGTDGQSDRCWISTRQKCQRLRVRKSAVVPHLVSQFVIYKTTYVVSTSAVISFWLRRPKFDRRTVCTWFVADNVAAGHVSSKYVGFLQSAPFHWCSILFIRLPSTQCSLDQGCPNFFGEACFQTSSSK